MLFQRLCYIWEWGRKEKWRENYRKSVLHSIVWFYKKDGVEKLHEIVREKKENKRKVGMKINFKYFSISVLLFKYRIKQGRGDFLNFLSMSLLFSEFQTKPQCMSLSFCTNTVNCNVIFNTTWVDILSLQALNMNNSFMEIISFSYISPINMLH